MKTEFEGYIRLIGAERPLFLECENECYNLRKEKFNRTFKDTKLSEVLDFIGVKDREIIGGDRNLGKYIIENVNAYEVLSSLKKQHLLYSFFVDKKLIISPIATSLQSNRKETYSIGKNTRKSNLKYIRASNKKIFIKLTSTQKDGSVISSVKEKIEGYNEVRLESVRPSNYTKEMLDKEVQDILTVKI